MDPDSDNMQVDNIDDDRDMLVGDNANMPMQPSDPLDPATPTPTPFAAAAPPAPSGSPPSLQTSPQQRSGVRRSRVEDDHDDERDRRHPSHRVAQSPSLQSLPDASAAQPASPSTSHHGGLPGIFRLVTRRSPGPSSPNNSTSPPPRPFRFFQHLIPPNRPGPSSTAPDPSPPVPHSPGRRSPSTASGTSASPASHSGPPSAAGPRGNPPPSTNTPNPHHQYLGGFAITIDMLGGMTTTPLPPPTPTAPDPNTATPNAAAPLQGQAPHDPGNGSDLPEPRGPTLPTPGSSPNNPGPGNAASAAAFAEVLARIGLLATLGIPGMGLEREVEDPERAKRLIEGLEEVPVGLVRRLERVGGTGGGMGQDISGGGDSGCAICWEKLLPDVDKPEAEETGNDGPKDSEQKIVSLPCAHVFHAECLIPWFSRPRHTTCPTCRFNIDPENLTYTSRALRQTAAEPQAAADGQEVPDPAVEDEQAQPQAIPGDEFPGSPGDEDEFGFPLFLGGFPPFLGGDHGDPQGPPHPQPAAVPVAQDASPQQTGTGPNLTTNTINENRTGRGFVTIGFDMYIGRGPPPPHPPRSAPASPTTNSDATATSNASGTPGQSQPPSQGGTGFGFTLPLPLGAMGVGRSIGDVLQRVFGGGGRGVGNGNNGDGAGNADGAGEVDRGVPVVFGPERPPAPLPGSIPATVGLGMGNAQRQQQPGGLGVPPVLLPFGFGSFPVGSPTPAPAAGTRPPMPQQPLPQRQQQPLPPFQLPQPQPQPQQGTGQHVFVGTIPLFDFLDVGLRSPHGGGGPAAPKRTWVPPPAPGLTLRQKIEKKEQEAGLRCCDVSCGVGPSDEEPWLEVNEQRMAQLKIWSSLSEEEGDRRPVCAHTFHTSCLVSAERVALALREAEVELVGRGGEEKEVEVSCPVCRGVGRVSKSEWEEGVKALR